MSAGAAECAGVALGGGQMAVAKYNAQHGRFETVLEAEPLQVENPADVVGMMAERLESIFGIDKLAVIGVSVGGHVSRDRQTVHFAPGILLEDHDWVEQPLGAYLGERLRLAVVIENDANCMTEFLRASGRTMGCRDLLVVYLAPDVQGIGCGIVVDGTLVRGAHGGAGELGHLVIQPNGPRCRCGSRGCLEAMLSVHNFNRDITWGGRSQTLGFAESARLVRNGDARIARVFSRAGRYLGQGLANAINLLNPELVVIGGPDELVHGTPISDSSADFFMKSMNEVLRSNSFGVLARKCDVTVAKLDVGVAACGAAMLAYGGVGSEVEGD